MFMSDEEMRSQRQRRWMILAAILVVLVAASGAYLLLNGDSAEASSADTEAAEQKKADQAPTVTVAIPQKKSVTRNISATGTLAARRELPVGIPGEGGQVARVYVDAGDWVKAGQTLASIDRSVQVQQINAMEAQTQVARADAKLAEAEMKRAASLVDRGFISKADIDRKTAAANSAIARVKVAEAQLSERRTRLGRLNIKAPAAGYVLERNIEPGQVVSPGSGVLFRLAKGGEMELRAQLSEVDLAAIPVGVSAVVVPTGSSKSFTGKVWQVSPTIDQRTRQGSARIALPYDKALRPGGFATVTINSGEEQASVVPESAVLTDSDGRFVYVVGKENKVERRPVTTGTVTDTGLAINSGLDGTEQIVLFAGGFLNPGETVKPKMQEAAK